jgi:hypothetical protein
VGGQIDDIRQQAAEEVAEREQLDRVVDIEPDRDGPPDPLAVLHSEPDEDQPAWRQW